jgi:hypothetical protein
MTVDPKAFAHLLLAVLRDQMAASDIPADELHALFDSAQFLSFPVKPDGWTDADVRTCLAEARRLSSVH